MTALLIGLDACDPGTVHAMAARGELPTLGRLLRDGGRATVQNPPGLYVGSLWESFATALSPVRHGVRCWAGIDPVSYEYQLIPLPTERAEPFWVTLSAAGRQVAVVDVPHVRADRAVDGFVVAEWGCHDRHFGLHSWPDHAAADLASAFGTHPVLGMDPWAAREFAPDDQMFREGDTRSVDEEHDLFVGMLAGLDTKHRLSTALLRESDADLFITVFGEAHSTGHQQWHLHDPNHPRFSAATRAAVGDDPVAAVYRRLDAAVAELMETAGANADVFVLLSHGMGPHFDGTHLLDGVLRRIDVADRSTTATARARRLTSSLPPRFAAVAAPAIRRATGRRNIAVTEPLVTPEQRREQRFYLEPNNYACGGIRINLAGREAAGHVRPDEVDTLVGSLREDLLALVNVETGDPVVRRVERAERWYPDRASDTDGWPDVFAEWERSSIIETVWSPKVGLVHAPYREWRTGDHRPSGELLMAGPGLPSGRLGAVDMADLGPTLAARLGVTLPGVDGRPFPAVLPARRRWA